MPQLREAGDEVAKRTAGVGSAVGNVLWFIFAGWYIALSHLVIAIAEFPSLADAERYYNSPEYTAARKFRVASTEGSVIITEGFVAPKQ